MFLLHFNNNSTFLKPQNPHLTIQAKHSTALSISTMMISNPATLTRKSRILSLYAAVSRKPNSHFNTQTTIHFPNNTIFNNTNTISLPCANGLRGIKKMGCRSFRVSSGNGGGTGGGSGGGSGGGNGGSSGSGGSNWSFLSWYMCLLAKYPMVTKAITSALLTLVGDLICQLAIDKVPSLDLKRTFIFTLLGLVLVGPTLHTWYLYLSKLVTTTGATGALMRLLLDQLIFAPVFIGIFLSSLITLEGKPSNVIPKLQQEWFSSVLANWQLWIPFQFFNFRFVPQQFQVLAANFVALIWNVILSYKAHKEVVAK